MVPVLNHAEIVSDKSLESINDLTLIDPLNIPNRTLQGTLFDGVSENVRSLRILQMLDARRFDLSDDFFQNFKSLEIVLLRILTTKIPPDLKSLTSLTDLHILRPEFTPEMYSGLHLLFQPDFSEISDTGITELGSEPFSGLAGLSLLMPLGLRVAEIAEDAFIFLDRLLVLRIEECANLTIIRVGTFSHTPNLMDLLPRTLPLLE